LLDKYQHWASYQPEEKAVVIAYASMYGNTGHVADMVAEQLVNLGWPVQVYDLSKTSRDIVLGEVFRASHLVLAAATHDGNVFEPMEYLLRDMSAHAVQGRKVALIENGTWAPTAAKQMQTLIESMKDMQIVEPIISLKSTLAPNQMDDLKQMVESLIAE